MNNITKYRLKNGINQSCLAKKLGLTRQLVSMAESSKITYNRAVKFSEALGTNPFELLGTDALVELPKTQEDKDFLLKTINAIEVE